MGKVIQSSETYRNYGECIKLSNGQIELLATTELGPRIIYFAGKNNVNFMFNDVDRLINNPDTIEPYGKPWNIYGGHRMWTAPESLRTYYPDSEPVNVQTIPNGVLLTANVQKWTHQQFSMQITMSPDDKKVEIVHSITNLAPFSAKFAIWALTVLAPGGREVVPVQEKDTGLLPNRIFVLWPYSKITDKRLHLDDKFVILDQDSQAETPFKLGINSQHCWAEYYLEGNKFVKTWDPKEGVFPDNGCNFETYTSDKILEMETLGELVDVQPGQTISHTERWEIVEGVEPFEVSTDRG